MPSPRDSLDRKLAAFGCLGISLASLFFSYAVVFSLHISIVEDGLVERLTAAFLLLASLLLFAAAKVEKVRLRRRIHLLGGLAMAFACGEELSWGQFVFGFTIPDFLVDRHNPRRNIDIHGRVDIVRNWYSYTLATVPLLSSIVICGAFFSRKEKVLGIPLPSPPLMLGMLLAIFFEYTIPEIKLWSIFSGPGVLLLSFFLFALFSKQVRLGIFTAALLTIPAATLYASHRCNCNAWYHEEMLEFLLALACLLYAAELWQAQRGFGEALRRLPAELKALVRRLPPPWLVASALMAAGSSGLVASAHLVSKSAADAALLAEDLRQIAAVKPSARSEFDVYLMEDSLFYFKEPCSRGNFPKFPFFVHIHPADPNDLPGHRMLHGFDNLDFNFDKQKGVMFDGKCLVKRQLRLPKNRAGVRIITGQYLPHENRRLWEAEFPLGD